jgi:uncharacterized protein YggT (Ycf19 family)
MPTDLLLLTIAKALAELAGLFILGQGVLYVLAGRNRESNFFYQILKTLTRPVYRLVRLVTPKVVVDRHIPMVAFIILFWLWVFLTIAKIQVCLGYGDLCKPRDDQAGLSRAERLVAAGEEGKPRL